MPVVRDTASMPKLVRMTESMPKLLPADQPLSSSKVAGD